MTDLPTGTVTFLFTDLEGSTRLWERHPDAMRDALARHDQILREAVEKEAGHVVKTTGDGLHAAFVTARDALAAAIEAQCALVAEPWSLPEPLAVRMGMHTGHADVRDGDYYGTAVNRAARVASLAHGGQIVASRAAEELFRDDLPAEVSLLDLGEHSLRDLARPEHLVQVLHPDLRHEFPALRSLDATPNNLPRQLASFIGRERDLQRLSDALPDSPIVTITGVGGVGKTRLAIQVAAAVIPHYADGAWIVELAPLHDEDALVPVVASGLGIQLAMGTDPREALVDVLRQRQLLLVLDNCEHLIEAVADFAGEIARRCDRVRILATSREALGVDGERTVPLRGLPVADDTPGGSAVDLFADRARVSRPDFTMTPDHRGAVEQICRRLDGIPLAIELAAARTKVLSPAAIAERLDQRFQLLAGGRRGAIERHQTLRAAIDWSYELLDDDERALLRRLAVFAGDFDLDAVEAVVGFGRLADAMLLDLLAALVDKSLVVVDDIDGAIRYRLLETIRQYAFEQLDAIGESAELRDRHFAHFLGVAESLSTDFVGPHEADSLRRIEGEADNLRAAVMWAVDIDRDDDAARLLVAVEMVGWFAGVNPIARWYEVAAERLNQEHPLSARCRAQAALYCLRSGDAPRAIDHCTTGHQVAALHGDAPVLLHVMSALTAMYSGRFDDAIQDLERAAPLATDDISRSILAANEAAIRSFASGYAAGREAAARAFATARRSGSPWLISQSLTLVAYAERDDNPTLAEARLQECLAATDPGDVSFGAQMAHSNLADLCVRRGDVAACHAHARQAITIGLARADWQALAQTFAFLALALHSLGRPDDAAEAIAVAVQMAPQSVFSPEYRRAAAAIDAALTPEALDAARDRASAHGRESAIAWIRATIAEATGHADA